MRIDLGLTFGGSSMTIAYFRDDKVSIIVNEAGDRCTPAVLGINGAEYSVGLPAKQNMIRNAKNTVFYTKHFIECADLASMDKDLLQKFECPMKINENEVVFELEKNNKPYDLSLSEAIEKQMKYLNELAKSSLGVKECDTVLAVPKYFKEEQAVTLKKCAEKAGFNVLRIVKNPIAACLAYNLEEDNTSHSNVLVYQMGGNSIEATLVEIRNGLFRCRDSIYTNDMGGDKFTGVVIDTLCEEFQRKHKANPKHNKRSLFKLKSDAEELKHILSTMERAHCSIDALYDGIDFDYYLTRQRFEGACNKIYQQALQPIDDLLARNNINELSVDKVILSGAATKMCKLQSLIKQKFSENKVLNQLSPDEIVSLGCAKQCALITNSRIKEITPADHVFKCLVNPIYVKVENKEDILIFDSHTPMPLKKDLQIELDLSCPKLSVFETKDTTIAKINLDSFKTKEISFLINIKLDETIEITVTEIATNEKITMFLNFESPNE